MPAPGQQHHNITNPYLEQKPRVAQWAAEEIATISAKLDKQLGPEYISSRSGPGGTRVHYLTAEKCITLANEVFGYNGWSSSIQNIQVDFADENPQTQRISLGLSVIVRVTLRDGSYHEDIGYGSIENARGKAMAFEKAKKEGTTDGLKRALRNFGNVLGNCIYDKEYVSQITKVKAQPAKKFDISNLYRQADFVERPQPPRLELAPRNGPPAAAKPATELPETAIKTELSESFDDYLGELDEADFCVAEEGHPDEVTVFDSGLAEKPAPAKPAQQQSRPQQPQTPGPVGARTSNTTHNNRPQPEAPNNPNKPSAPQAPPAPNQPPNNVASIPMDAPYTGPVGFFSARAVKDTPAGDAQAGNAPLPALSENVRFNPNAESPSIPRTPGIDHTKTKPLARNGQHVPPTMTQQAAADAPPKPPNNPNTGSFTPVRPNASKENQGQRASAVNPSLDQARRIGAPSRPGSPLANRGSYKPPTMKRSLPGEVNTRTPLADLPVTANGNGGTAVDVAPGAGVSGTDSKRQKMG